MRRALPALALLAVVLPRVAAAEAPPLLDRAALSSLDAILRIQGAGLADLATATRDLAPPGLPFRSALVDGPLAAPLTAPDAANALATRVATDLGARGAAGWSGTLSVVAESWGLEPGWGAGDGCAEARSGRGLADQHMAASGRRWSKREIADLQGRLHSEIDRLVGALVDDAAVASCRVDDAFASLPAEGRAALLVDASRLLSVPDEPTPDDLAAVLRLAAAWSRVDRAALLRAGRDWTAAVDGAAAALSGLDAAAWPSSPVIWTVGAGEVWIGSPGPNSGSGDPVLLVDPGGDDHWRLRADATELAATGVRGWIDLGGDDVWRSGAAGGGAAVFGVTAGFDRAGDDLYAGSRLAQGAGLFGVATWLDGHGGDRYDLDAAGHGFGLLGAGALVDVGRGADVYTATGIAQGIGLAGGLGVLHDDGGDDRYLLTSDGSGPRRCDGGCGQGAGFGIAPISAGGVGLLVDGGGDDLYAATERAQAAARMHGLGVLRDGGGRDTYGVRGAGVAWSDRSAVAVLIDASGSDRYAADWGGVARAEEHAVAWLIDLEGDDVYSAPLGLGAAQGRSSASLLVDGDGFARWDGGMPGWTAGALSATATEPPIGAAVGRRDAPRAMLLGGLGTGVQMDRAGFEAALPGLGWPYERRLDEAGRALERIARTGSGDLVSLAQRIAKDALARPSASEDPTTTWHLSWLADLARSAPAAVGPLEQAASALIEHPSWRVRAAAWEARAAIGAIDGLQIPEDEALRLGTAAAVGLQKERQPEVRAAAAGAAGAFGTAGVAASLAAALLSDHLGTRRAAEAALVAVAGRTDGVAIARGLYGIAAGDVASTPATRDAALRVLGVSRQRDALPILQAALADPSTALPAAIGLARFGGKPATAALDAWRATASDDALRAVDDATPRPPAP